MNLVLVEGETDADMLRRRVLHEFGHALGLIHEHQSPAAGIKWRRDDVYSYFEAQFGWSRETVDRQVLNAYTSRTITNYSTFDAESIMVYEIPPELTTDGVGVPWNSDLSATDRQYIARWYPRAVAPATASGLLRTGDDCDEIDFQVEYNVVAADQVAFNLSPSADMRWWKAIEVPRGGGYTMFQMQDGNSSGGTVPHAEIDQSRAIRFWKAKAFGVHTCLGFSWDVLQALPGGSRLSFVWRRDQC